MRSARLAGLLLLLLAGCEAERRDGRAPAPGGEVSTPPRISAPGALRRPPLAVDPGALPQGARAHFPAYDGDPVFVTLPGQEEADTSAHAVFAGVITPVLKALRFEHGAEAFLMPPAQGVKPARADLSRLAQALADEYARNPKLQRAKTRSMLDAFLGKERAGADIDRALSTGEGMTFAQYVAGIQRQEIQYPFQQVHDGVPIEHTMLVATRWEGQGVTSVHGTIFNRYAVENKPRLGPEAVVGVAVEALRAAKRIEPVPAQRPLDGPRLVLLPYGTNAAGTARFRYAHRLLLRAVFGGQEGRVLLWLDAETGVILKLESFAAQVSASGATFNRDPGVGTTTASFDVDAAAGGQYTLQQAAVANRVDYGGDGYTAADVAISDTTTGSSATLANFAQAPLDDAAQALCATGSNKGFQQVNFFATLTRHHGTVLGQGIFTPFPDLPWSPQVDTQTCGSWFNMNFGACLGYTHAACPNYSDGTTGTQNLMNFAHDNTMIAHELGHNATWRLTILRPPTWCGAATCALPTGWAALHDLADFWGAHLESTNCIGGWVAKNLGGVDASRYCLRHDERNSLPRLLDVATPFNPAAPGDHFPEHRALGSDDYADGQIGGAALWKVREGMRSKCRPSGLPQFGVRFQRALQQTGFFGVAPDSSDTGIYRLLYDLEVKMTDQWAASGSPGGPPAFRHNGPHTTSKVTAGFARAGIFLIPYQCLDGQASTTEPMSCPSGENGGDAVIDIDDNDPADDLVLNEVTHREVDFLRLGGPVPTFHVWTGPRYRLNGGGGASTTANPAPCNGRFRVEVSTDPAFPAGSTITGAWQTVPRDPASAAPACYGAWTPSSAEWTTLQAGGGGSRIYYRARTQDAGGGNERLSTLPGNGLWSVPPPYAVITPTGQSDY
jgi:hypothetical protein